MKLPDIHDFSATALYQQATQILHSSQTFSIEEEGGIVSNRKRASPNPLASG